MKSAFERALEKAERLGKLSPEEMRERNEAEYAPIGRALAERYLDHGDRRILKEELRRYSIDEQAIVMGSALSRLVAAIDLASYEISGKALNGLLTLKGKGRIGEIDERIKSLLGEFQDVQQQRYEMEKERIEKGDMELLHQLRISGSALGAINLKASETWETISQELYSQFNERLGALKRELLSLLEES
ncbi:MAG: hypothetical protein KAH98_05150 [Dehalococcoidia bacterium]|nr:hypothetical protein [Dehalococcoidia bacterium]